MKLSFSQLRVCAVMIITIMCAMSHACLAQSTGTPTAELNVVSDTTIKTCDAIFSVVLASADQEKLHFKFGTTASGNDILVQTIDLNSPDIGGFSYFSYVGDTVKVGFGWLETDPLFGEVQAENSQGTLSVTVTDQWNP